MLFTARNRRTSRTPELLIDLHHVYLCARALTFRTRLSMHSPESTLLRINLSLSRHFPDFIAMRLDVVRQSYIISELMINADSSWNDTFVRFYRLMIIDRLSLNLENLEKLFSLWFHDQRRMTEIAIIIERSVSPPLSCYYSLSFCVNVDNQSQYHQGMWFRLSSMKIALLMRLLPRAYGRYNVSELVFDVCIIIRMFWYGYIYWWKSHHVTNDDCCVNMKM